MLIRLFSFCFILLWPVNSRVAGIYENSSPDLVIEYRLAELNISTPVSLDYNEHVKKFIQLFSGDRREAVRRIIGLSELYFPIIEEILDRNNLPLEIKYICVIESALDPFAVSRSGAVGLWQFLLHTARMFDLEVNSYIDHRRDVYKSTEAAARYMAYLYEMFGDWHLVFAAYNSGPGVVRNAIERSGGNRNYWEIRKFLPEQSQRFVPAFIAINYMMSYYGDYNIEPLTPEFTFESIDTLHISRPLGLKQIGGELNIPIETLRFLNPVYRLDYIPANGLSNTLVLPSEHVIPFLNNYERVFVHGISHSSDAAGDKNINDELIRITHRVRPGDFIHKIAMMYGTISEKIMEWNKLGDDLIHAGQELIIWVSPAILRQLDDSLPFSVDDPVDTDQ